MSLIDSSLEHVYCSNLVSNHVLIRLIRFVSRFTIHLCNAIYFSTIFSILYKRFTKILHFAFWDLNKPLIERRFSSRTPSFPWYVSALHVNLQTQQVHKRPNALFSSHSINSVNAKKNITLNVSTHVWSTK